METTPLIDLETIAKQLNLALPSVQRTTELLEEGNTVPFITRFRKDQTGGLDEQQVRLIETELSRAKLLAERKETILKSIESRGKLTNKLAKQIDLSKTIGELEDVYLPYKPKKQSLASLARSKGLEPFANTIIEATETTTSIEEQAVAFVDQEKDLPDTNAVVEGVKHLVAEYFGNHPKLRSLLRRHLWRAGKLISKQIDQSEIEGEESTSVAAQATKDSKRTAKKSTDSPSLNGEPEVSSAAVATVPSAEVPSAEVPSAEVPSAEVPSAEVPSAEVPSVEVPSVEVPSAEVPSAEAPSAEVPSAEVPSAEVPSAEVPSVEVPSVEVPSVEVPSVEVPSVEVPSVEVPSAEVAVVDDPAAEVPSPDVPSVPDPTATDASSVEAAESAVGATATPSGEAAVSKVAKVVAKPKDRKKAKGEATSRRDQRRETRRRRRERLVQSFKDYFDFSDPIGRIPHHRILAINRGERTKVLRVKIECSNWDKVQAETEATAIQPDHPHADFLRVCLQDAMGRLLQPSIEREVRRELNEQAEEHAVRVFARNLRKLLLQPPLRKHRVVAIDPGFRSGCKLVALDEFGQMLGHTFINLLGKEQQKQDGRAGLAKFVQEHKATVVAVGNGAACRETETLVAEVLGNELKDQDVGYLIVNEAGTSVYSTSDLGREELPDFDATVRSAVSIGRRSLDPLSELVKIDPASIGVGLYQHDVKAKHLRESLDAVVESCVNYVGVDVNSASPALLRYVSGLNSLTARRIYEHRQKNGPFKNREQLKDVSGIGESTYVQAAGFLKIVQGENPLDGTWIHPESYATATKVLEAIGYGVSDLHPGTRSYKTESETAELVSSNIANAAQAPTELPSDDAGSDLQIPESLPIEAQSSEAPPAEAQTSEAQTSEAQTSEAQTSEAQTSEVRTVEPTAIASPSDDTLVETSVGTSVDATPTLAATQSSEGQNGKSLRAARMKELGDKLASVDVDQLAPSLGVGKLLLQDILNALARPGRDPREDLPQPIFRTGILKLEDLKPGMELSGTVLNVVDFGAFVDIGLVDSGLIHVSRLADRYISDPHDVVSVGDILRVWVVEVDQKRRRVSLTAIEPGTEKPKQEKKPRAKRKPRPEKKEAGKSRKFNRAKDHKASHFKPKAPPKPVVPITKGMEEGSEPMRTFGDLKQLFDKKKRDS